MTAHPPPLRQHARAAAQYILERTSLRPRVAMLLGTGHASVANQLKERTAVAADELPGELRSHSPFLVGLLDGSPVVVADAPIATYEGYATHEVTFPVRVLRAMGCETLILTAGAASLSQQLEPGSIAVIEDHLNFSNIHPLHGENDDQLGPRFPDMSEPYSIELRALAREIAGRVGIQCLPGVFASVPGPSLPTRAEYRFLRMSGADLVGMSLVPEVLAAVHAGFSVLALVGITQHVLPDNPGVTPIETMLEAAELAAPRMGSILVGLANALA